MSDQPLSDADFFGTAPVTAQAAPQPPVPTGAPMRPVVYPDTGQFANNAQTAAYNKMVAAGQIDPNKPVGAPENPAGFRDGDNPAPGLTYLDGDGKIQTATAAPTSSVDLRPFVPPAAAAPAPGPQIDMSDEQMFGPHVAPVTSSAPPKVDEGLGAELGFMKPTVNALALTRNALGSIPLIGGGAVSATDKLGSMFGMPTPDLMRATLDATQEQAADKGVVPGKIGLTVGDLAGTAVPALLTKSPILAGAAGGALNTDNPDDPWNTAIDAASGAVGGKVMSGLMGGLASAVAPRLSASVKLLTGEGVPLTPGQTVGGTAHRLEDGSTSIPMLGDMIKNRQVESLEGFNRAAINRSLAPIGQSLPDDVDIGRDGVGYAHDTLSKAYGSLLPGLKVQMDPQFAADIGSTLGQAKGVLTPDRYTQLSNIVKSRVAPRFDATGSMDGTTMKDVDSQLGLLSRRAGASQDMDQQTLGDAIGAVRDHLRDVTGRSNPAQAPQLNAINTGWANLKRVEHAAAQSGATNGVFTAPQLARSVRALDNSPDKTAYARGSALMQDLADAGKDVLPSTVPDSGSPYRHALEAFVALGVGKEAKFLNIPTMLGVAAPTALYSKSSQKLLAPLLSGGRPTWAGPIADAIRSGRVPMIGAGAMGAADAMNTAFPPPPSPNGAWDGVPYPATQ